jgi:hypothetical protein
MKLEMPPVYPPPGRIVMDVTDDPEANEKELAACIATAYQLGGLIVYVPRTVLLP